MGMDRAWIGHFSLERVGFGENSYRVSSPRNAFDKSRSIFFFFFYFALVRLAPPPPHRSPRHSLLHEFHDFFLVHASARPSHALHSRSPYPFLWKFPAENILPLPLPRDEIRGTLKFLYFRSIFGRYVLYPKNIYSSQDLFGEIKKQKTFINFNEYRDIDFLTFFFKTLFLLLLTSLESS